MHMTITYRVGKGLYLNITNQCPNRCDFCVRTHSDFYDGSNSLWLEREPTSDEIFEAICKEDLTAYQEIVFCGYGEPLCRMNQLLEVAEMLKKVTSLPIRVNTSGLSDLMYGQPTAQLMQGLVDTVSVSLNASTPEKYDQICHSKYGLDALPAILEFTKEAVCCLPHVVMTVVDVIGQEEIEACRALCQQTGAEFRVREYID